jgi:hypothetical protein
LVSNWNFNWFNFMGFMGGGKSSFMDRQRLGMVRGSTNVRGRGQVMDKCRYCGLRGLVLSTINADYSCEHCGEWQEAILNSAWEIIDYEREGADK